MPAAPEARREAILKAIVADYVVDGEPVGSRRLVEELGLGVSPATVRADMAVLENEGFIAQPHTSAGRVPTDKGYRFYVDALAGSRSLLPEHRAALDNLMRGSADIEDLLRRASTVLSRLTHHASLVATPRLDRTRLRHIELVALSPTTVLVIVIVDTGQVRKRTLELDEPVVDHDLQRTLHAVNSAAAELPLVQAPDAVAGMANAAPTEVRVLLEAIAEALRHEAAGTDAVDRVFVGGSANLVGAGHFDRLEQISELYALLEEQVVLLEMLRSTLEAGDPAVRIGEELPLVELAACSVVASSYDVSGQPGGSIGIIGPTRMDYPQTLAVVEAVASSIEAALTGEPAATDG